MTADFLLVPGGLGIFLLGMTILTDGLRQLAGGALRRLLADFTKTPWRAAAAGGLATAAVQSSSATTVTAVGFVGAGLLTFPQGLGIVFGANLGTTVTGWIVAVLGFKLQLGQLVLPLVLAGVLLRLFGRGQLRHGGWALAGFGLLFVGIDAMQQGMAPFEGQVTPADFPPDSTAGRLQLVAMGALITLVTQSSSAGVAAALVALGAGSISFAQAAALVIGMDVGTTVTAVLATLGGSTAARQTGYAHVVYNLMTGTLAFFLLTPFARLVEFWFGVGASGAELSGGGAGGISSGDAQIALVAFHSAFNGLGILLAVPLTRPFAAMIQRLVPERGPPLLRHLDRRALRDPQAAVDAAAATIAATADELQAILRAELGPEAPAADGEARLAAVAAALAAAQDYVEEIRSGADDPPAHRRHIAAMHALDHLRRLAHRCGQQARIAALHGEPRLSRLSGLLRGAASLDGAAEDPAAAIARFDRLQRLLRDQLEVYRRRTVEAAARQEIGTATALARQDSVRWLYRVAYHLWRIELHLSQSTDRRP